MKILIENWRKFLAESQDIDLAHDYIYRYEDLRISFAEKVSEILFAYQGKNSISQVPLQDRISLAAKPNSLVRLSEVRSITTPTQEEINLFRQDAEMLFDAMEADREMVNQQIDNVARKVDPYIDKFIEITSNSPDDSYEGRLEHIKNLRDQIGYEESPIYSQEQRDFVQSLIVKPLKGAKDPRHPFPVGSVKDKKIKKLGLSGLLTPLRKQFKQTRKGGLPKRSISKYNKALGQIWDSMSDLELKDTHEETLARFGDIADAFFHERSKNYEVVIPRGQSIFKRVFDTDASNYIPVADLMTDKYQVALMHYFNPDNLHDNARLADEGATKTQLEIDDKISQLKAMQDPEQQKILKGNIAKLTLDRNINRKRARMIRKDIDMYRQGFENRLDGQDAALPLPKPYGTMQYTGYAQQTGFRNLGFGGAQANIFKDTGVKDRTVEDEDDVLRTLEYYLEEVGEELPNPVQGIYDEMSEGDKQDFQSMLFRNYVHAQAVGIRPSELEQPTDQPNQPTASIDSLDDLDMDELGYYMDELNFADAPVQGTGEEGDIDLEDEQNIAWMVGEINKMIQMEAT